MESQIQIDFRYIRPFDGDRRKGFEEFVCQLARRKPPADPIEFRRVEGAGGDGGVEAYWTDSQGAEHGVQAKYFLATKEINWSQIDKSVDVALKQHSLLTSYSIAVACDLTDRSGALGKGKTGWEHWETHKKSWEKLAANKGMVVDFSIWTKSDLVDDLVSHTDRQGLALFWFNAEILDDARLARLFESARADLGERFHPEDNVRTTLTQAFGGMRRSPVFVREIANWFLQVPDTSDVERDCALLPLKLRNEHIVELREATNRIRAIGAEIESSGLDAYPGRDWHEAIVRFFSAASNISSFLDGIPDPIPAQARDIRRYLSDVGAHLDTHMPFVSHIDSEPLSIGADRTRFVIITGEPGSGKSHLFADGVSSALSEGCAAVLMLGQHFSGGLRKSFLSGLGMKNQEFNVALQALDAAGELVGQRTLVLIDALNEAPDLRVWPSELAGFISDLLKYKHIAIGLSLRSEYLNVLVPRAVKDMSKVMVHRGIITEDEQEQAAVQYFEKRGITRPTVPWLAPEFSNFLFLRTVCDAISSLGKSEFPRGLRGSLDILKYFLDSVDEKVRRSYPSAAIPVGAVLESVSGIAGWMAGRKLNYVDLKSAAKICASSFNSDGPESQKGWFNILISEGIFRSDHLLPSGDTTSDDPLGRVPEVFRFSYQRFSDHLIVRSLLADVSDIDAAFVDDGKLSHLMKDKDWRWSSLWQALAVQIPEKYAGVEIFDVAKSEDRRISAFMKDAFSQSLLWRSPKAFTERTLFYFNHQELRGNNSQVETLLRLSTVKDQPWNADFLCENLLRMPLAKRDSFWSVSLNQSFDDYGDPAHEIISWCSRAPIEKADGETLRLAAVTLAWFFATTHRRMRDSATKVLVRLIGVRPSLGSYLLDQFSNVNDLYVLERICCAVYSATVRSIDGNVIGEAATAIYRNIFDRSDVPLDLLLRDYSTGVIDYAISQSSLPDAIDPAKCRAPFKSAWPLSIPSEDEIAIIVNAAGDSAIEFSAGKMGDFGSYEIETSVRHFTSVPLSEERPLNGDEQKEKLEQIISTWSVAIQSAYLRLLVANAALRNSLKFVEREQSDLGVSYEYDATAVKEFEAARADLVALLDKSQQATFDKLSETYLVNAPSGFGSRRIQELPLFDAEDAKRWVVSNAYLRGWSSKLFPGDGYPSGSRGHRPAIERIGKKYQWLALSELQARLSDNVWSVRSYTDKVMVYEHPTSNWFVRDIEPSILTNEPKVEVEHPWWLGAAESLPGYSGEISAWPTSEAPPSGRAWLNVTDPDGKPWFLLHTFWSERQKRSGGKSLSVISTLRQMFVRVSTIIVNSMDAEVVLAKLKGERLADPSGHEAIDWTDGPYLLEFPWRSTWDSETADGFEQEPWPIFSGTRYIRPVARHVWESHLDASLDDGFRICVPHPWIARRLGVRASLDQIGTCVDLNGRVIFFDPAQGTDRFSSCLVDPETFKKFLSDHDLECIWIVAGERNAYPSGKTGDYSCRTFAGLHRFRSGQWVSEEWFVDTASK